MSVVADGIDVTDLANKVFDLATNSMDFGSGFLDDTDVIALRRFARALGRDPEDGTPAEWVGRGRKKGLSGAVLVESEHATTRVCQPGVRRLLAVMCLCGWTGPFREEPKFATNRKEEWEKEHAEMSRLLAADADTHIGEMLELAKAGS